MVFGLANTWLVTDNKAHLVLLASGADRTVYALDDYTVIKFGNQEANVKEWFISSRASNNNKAIARVLNHADDFSWITMERATTVFEPSDHQFLAMEMKKHLGLTSSPEFQYPATLVALLQLIAVKRKKIDSATGPMSKLAVWLLTNPTPWFTDLLTLVNECGLNVNDLHTKNWGMIGDKLVIIDYGF